MQAMPAFDQSFEQRLARVDLTAVMGRVKLETGLSDADLVLAEDLYRKFLTLKAKHMGTPFVPPQIADIVWHTHIIFTKQYMADCDMLFGEYLHHTPSDEPQDVLEGYYTRTKGYFEEDYGIDLMKTGFGGDYLRASGCP